MIVPIGPAWLIVQPELRNRPVPITPPKLIIIRWRDVIERRSPLGGCVSCASGAASRSGVVLGSVMVR